MARRHYRRYTSYKRNSGSRTASRAARFAGRAVGRVGFGTLKFGTRVASHIIVAGVGTAAKVIRSIARG